MPICCSIVGAINVKYSILNRHLTAFDVTGQHEHLRTGIHWKQIIITVKHQVLEGYSPKLYEDLDQTLTTELEYNNEEGVKMTEILVRSVNTGKEANQKWPKLISCVLVAEA